LDKAIPYISDWIIIVIGRRKFILHCVPTIRVNIRIVKFMAIAVIERIIFCCSGSTVNDICAGRKGRLGWVDISGSSFFPGVVRSNFSKIISVIGMIKTTNPYSINIDRWGGRSAVGK
jgi:hypothetical protein